MRELTNKQTIMAHGDKFQLVLLYSICKIIGYPDRRIKPIVYTMTSSGIRVGAWDYLKWNDVSPIIRDGKLLVAKNKMHKASFREGYSA
jgi:hypothetical protein